MNTDTEQCAETAMPGIFSRDAIRLDDEPETPETPEKEGEEKSSGTPQGELEHKLFKRRTVLIFGGINDKIARDVTGRLLALAGESDKPINVYVNSPGGHVESGDTIHDMIRFVDSIA
ncbi:ATP-dependent Clp protease proteolytic subunit, partial [Acetobacter papayae]